MKAYEAQQRVEAQRELVRKIRNAGRSAEYRQELGRLRQREAELAEIINGRGH